METSAVQVFGHVQRIFDVRFDPAHSEFFASGSDDTTVRIWKRDKNTGTVRQVETCRSQITTCMALPLVISPPRHPSCFNHSRRHPAALVTLLK